jgi:membrane-bound ClpP family serine protease
MMSGGDQEGFKASSFRHELIGKVGIAQTDLRPLGTISVEGEIAQATTPYGFIPEGSSVIITGGNGATLIVHPESNSSNRPSGNSDKPKS